MEDNLITKKLKDYTNDELNTICNHYNYSCVNCPISDVLMLNNACLIDAMNWNLTVKESDLKDG